MRRFLIDKKAIKGKVVFIEGDEAHHIKDVIRLSPGDRFLGFDGTGKTYTLRVINAAGKVEAEIEKVSTRKLNIRRVLLACALPKAGKMDYIMEKLTELGACDIIPMVTQRTIVKLDDKGKAARSRRWQKIALAASKQSGRDILPNIHNISNFKDAVELTKKLGYNKKIMPCLCEGSRRLNEALSGESEDIAAFIGPEGDFTDKEIEYARQCGFIMVSLGELVLRVDTACIFTVSAIQSRI